MGNVPPNQAFDPAFFENLFHDIPDAAVVQDEQAPQLRTGDRVILHGLTTTELNGRYALVLSPQPLCGRFHLRVEDDGKEIRARSKNFTPIVTKPTQIIDVEAVQDDVDTSTLLRGDCVVCLGQKEATQAVIPCGHLCLCDGCAPQARASLTKCPLCRSPMTDTVRIFLPTVSNSEENQLKTATDRCHTAEKRAADLEDQLERERRIKKARTQRMLAQGMWIHMPTAPQPPNETQGYALFMGMYGTIAGIQDDTVTVRFQHANEEAFVQQGKKVAGGGYAELLSIPIDTPFRVMQSVRAPDKLCVLKATRDKRKAKVDADKARVESERKAAQEHSGDE